MFNIAIVEDDPNYSDMLEDHLKKYQNEFKTPIKTTIFSNGGQFLQESTLDFDIVFMDIDMPHMNGLDTARKFRILNKVSILIFVTNLAQYAIKGYEVNALDYILKPVNYDSLKVRLNRAIDIFNQRKSKKINLKVKNGVKVIDISDIYYIEVIKHRLYYHTSFGEIEVWGSMTQAEEELKDYGFSRCNACYLINLKHVDSVEDEMLSINNELLKISRTKKKDFTNSLLDYMQGIN